MKVRTTLTALCAAAVLGSGAMGAQAGGHEELLRQMPQSFPGESFALREFPGESFSDRQLQAFASGNINTIGDLVQADPQQVGRVLEIDPRSAQSLQHELRQRVR